ncbi:MAG: hypothetical protein ACD_58C00056G0003 [uncultured bacterium]|nr:MAG: hypothetical protein ACD_58C00056G0003 [uncultured bacterium]
MVKDRITKKTQTLLWLPWIGGDRGGPAPIPDIFWDNSSDYIYTGFTPVIEVSGDFDIEYHNSLKSGYISILKIPVDGSNLKELTDPTPSYMMTEEQAIRLNFSDDFSKVLYYIAELDDDTDIESSYDWIWGITDGNNSQITKITDLKSNESWVVDVGCEECNICVRSYDKSYPSYISDDFAYFLYNSVVENDVWFVIDKFNFNENKQEELIRVPSFGGENQFYDISYYPESDIILFRVNNTLYQLHNGGLSILLENVLDINYYSN